MSLYPKLKHLMVQGCTSDAGKTVLVAGLCRWLKNKNLSVTPFKPQNMALNSAVTTDGGEIGRAQALQAIAAGLDAHTDMNPVLIKPSSDTKAQIILQGKAHENLNAGDFHDYKKQAMPYVLDSFKRLRETYKHIIIEGAGSPAEINLRKNDIANMGFAEEIDCPVILIADIDRGGVFAHLVGTLALLSQSEQKRIIGFVINRFRGDIKLLEPGLDWLEKKTGKPVIGVLPFIKNFYLDAEDALKGQTASTVTKHIFTVVVPVFERISNHTDFDSLALRDDVHLIYAAPGQPLPAADLIILPGTKNVRKDLTILKQYGWDTDIKKHLRFAGKLFGICGGYQMLGKSINDPLGLEDQPGSTLGLGLLDIQTELKKHKTLKQVSATFIHNAFPSIAFDSYEIHHGETTIMDNSLAPLLKTKKGEEISNDGVINFDNNIAGCYQHGILDQVNACNAVLGWAGKTTINNEKNNTTSDLSVHREKQLERLSAILNQHLDKSFLESFTHVKL